MGVTGHNVARCAALWAGCPPSTSGATINRFCSSGLQAIVSASQHVLGGAADVSVGAGVESISMVGPLVAKTTVPDQRMLERYPAMYMPMIETADILSRRYGISREDSDYFSVESQKRTAAAQLAGLYDYEIVAMATKMCVGAFFENGVRAKLGWSRTRRPRRLRRWTILSPKTNATARARRTSPSPAWYALSAAVRARFCP